MVAVVPPASEILQNSLLAQESGKKNSSHMMEVPSSSPCPVAKKKHSDTKRTNDTTTTTDVANDVHHGETNNVVPNNLKLYPMIEIKEVACYLSLLEGGDVQDKLEFVFRVYDSDNNQYLDQQVSMFAFLDPAPPKGEGSYKPVQSCQSVSKFQNGSTQSYHVKVKIVTAIY